MLLVLLAVPLLLPPLSALILGMRLSSLWTMPAWFLLPIVLLAPPSAIVTRTRAVQVAIAVAILSLGALVAAPVVAYAMVLRGPKTAHAHYRALAEDLAAAWSRETRAPLRIVFGDAELSPAMTFYVPGHPDSVQFFDLDHSPWISPERVRQEGWVAVCRTDDPGCMGNVEMRLGDAAPRMRRHEIELARSYLGRVGVPERFTVAIVPPSAPVGRDDPRRAGPGSRTMSEAARDWIRFWDQPHSIYVNARHLDVHYRDIAEGIARLIPKSGARVLDYGCGEARHADLVAQNADLVLSDSSTSVRDDLARRFAGHPRIRIAAPQAVESLPDGSFDMIVANSMVQYLSAADLDRLLALWRRLLAPDGVLIVGDVIPPDVSVVSDVAALLRYAAHHGFLVAALFGLVRTVASPYRRLRAKLGIACYGEAQFLAKLAAAGYVAERLPFNLEHNPARMTFRARPQGIRAGGPAP